MSAWRAGQGLASHRVRVNTGPQRTATAGQRPAQWATIGPTIRHGRTPSLRSRETTRPCAGSCRGWHSGWHRSLPSPSKGVSAIFWHEARVDMQYEARVDMQYAGAVHSFPRRQTAPRRAPRGRFSLSCSWFTAGPLSAGGSAKTAQHKYCLPCETCANWAACAPAASARPRTALDQRVAWWRAPIWLPPVQRGAARCRYSTRGARAAATDWDADESLLQPSERPRVRIPSGATQKALTLFIYFFSSRASI